MMTTMRRSYSHTNAHTHTPTRLSGLGKVAETAISNAASFGDARKSIHFSIVTFVWPIIMKFIAS